MSQDKILIVFDWDGVVFDTAQTIKIRDRLLKKLGYSEAYIKSSIKAVVHSKGGYNFHSHAKFLVRAGLHDSRTLAKIIREAVDKHPGTFVFPDARRTLSSLKRGKYHFDVLTAGHEEFQEYKVVRSGLRSMFRNVHIVRSGPRVPHYKFGVLKKLAHSHPCIIFLDDRVDTIEMIKNSPVLRGKVLPVLVWRKKGTPPNDLPMLRKLSWKGIKKIAIHNGFKP